MNPPLIDFKQSLVLCMVTSPEDAALDKRSAWMYGVIVGWREALPEVAKRHGWTSDDVQRLEYLHRSFELTQPVLPS